MTFLRSWRLFLSIDSHIVITSPSNRTQWPLKVKEYSLPEEPDLPMSASERWIGFLVWCRCFLSSTKLILSLRSGDIMPSSICLSIMSSVSKHMHFTWILLSGEPPATWKAFLSFFLRCWTINALQVDTACLWAKKGKSVADIQVFIVNTLTVGET